MTDLTTCPKCGSELPAQAPAGLCPKCLLQAGLDSQASGLSAMPATEASPAPSRGFVPPQPEELAARFPQLEIMELLGKGGMGAVYKARQPHLDRTVAIKILPAETSHDPSFAERFSREARALARLNHPHIVAVYDFGQADGLFYFVMEYVDGVNLRQAIQTGKLQSAETLAIVPQICEALQYAHDEGVVHRDIKPENILVDKKGRVKIADFGLAKLLKADEPDHGLTGTHQVMGTPRYMAPEQLEGAKQVDHRADIYSLGVVFYELLTGELPIGRFAPPSKKVQIDVRLDEVVLRALEKEPELRYQHASELKTSVDHVRQTPSLAVAAAIAAAPAGRKTDLPPTAPDARLSRCALAGAFLVPFIFVALLVVSASWFAIGAVRHPTVANQLDGAPVSKSILIPLLAVVGLIGFVAPLGTTVLGFVAISHIRRSAGKLYGLPLAVFDALVFPLLLLDGLIMTLVAAATMTLLAAVVMALDIPFSNLPISDALPALLVLSISLPIIAWVDYRIARAVWRNVTGFEPPPKPQAAAGSVTRATGGPQFSWQALTLSIVPLALLIGWIAYFGGAFLDSARGEDARLVFLGAAWGLGASTQSVQVSVFAIGTLLFFLTEIGVVLLAQQWTRAQLGRMSDARARATLLVRGPAIGLIVMSLTTAIVALLLAVVLYGAQWFGDKPMTWNAWTAPLGFLIWFIAIFKIWTNAEALLRLESRQQANAAVREAFNPFLNLLVYLPVAIWAQSVVSQSEVQAALPDKEVPSEEPAIAEAPAVLQSLPPEVAGFSPVANSSLNNAWQAWRVGQPERTANVIKAVLLIVTFICLGLFMSFHGTTSLNSANFEIGTPWPWLKIEQQKDPINFSTNVILQSWEWLIALVSAGAFYIYDQIKKSEPQPKSKSEANAWKILAAMIVLGPMLLIAFQLVLFTKLPTIPSIASPAATTAEAKSKSATVPESPSLSRFYALGKLSQEAFDRGDSDEAAKLAEEYLKLAAKLPKDWNYGNAIHDANTLLGLVALERADVAAAKKYLLAAGQSTGSPQLNSFGPNFELATVLLARGEKQTVLDYLAAVDKFWAMGRERLARFAKTIEAGGTPPELKLAESLLTGSWLAEASYDDKSLMNRLLEFNADGSGSQCLLNRTTTKHRVVDGKLVMVNPDSGKDEPPQGLEFKDSKLTLNVDRAGLIPEQKVVLTRVAADSNSGILVGTWTGKMHIEDLGDADISYTFDSNDAGSLTIELRMPAAIRFTYTWKGEKLKYMLNGRPREAKCHLANDRLTLTGFATQTDDKPHVFLRYSPATRAADKP